MKNKIFLIGMLFILLASYGCEKLHDLNQPKEPDTKYSSTYPISGEWWVVYYMNDGDGGLIQISDYTPFFTYNTSADDGKEIWAWDDGNFDNFRVKTACDIKNLTFTSIDTLTNTADGAGDGHRVLLSNGFVIKNGGHSPSGVVVDSVYAEFRFEDDGYYDDDDNWVSTPFENTYIAAGVRKTGFLEDEH
jgi:hypothetical protein